MNPSLRAEKAAAAMWAEDNASQGAGLVLQSVDEGIAVVSLKVEPRHCNGHGMCHGGITFMLADTAFAFACNSRNQRSVAQHNSITYLQPAWHGDTLTARAQELVLSGRSGIYDVRVTRQTGEAVAEFRGTSRIIKGCLFEENGSE